MVADMFGVNLQSTIALGCFDIYESSVPFMAVIVWELFGVWGCLVAVFAALLCLRVQ